MNQVRVGNCIFGDGIPKICVPLTGHSEMEILSRAEKIRAEAASLEASYSSRNRDGNLRVSMVEFRADYYDDICSHTQLSALMRRLREIFAGRLLLFTYRSEEEGGELRHDRAENMTDDIYDWIISEKLADLIDVELLTGNYHVVRTTTKAHDHGIFCVVSNHDFEKTPRSDKTLEMLRSMEILGGDILKCVSMPRSDSDVERVMDLCRQVTENRIPGMEIHQPVVMISMGEKGKISRLTGRKTGSAFTFAAASTGQESAPGQLTLSEVFAAFAEEETNP